MKALDQPISLVNAKDCVLRLRNAEIRARGGAWSAQSVLRSLHANYLLWLTRSVDRWDHAMQEKRARGAHEARYGSTCCNKYNTTNIAPSSMCANIGDGSIIPWKYHSKYHERRHNIFEIVYLFDMKYCNGFLFLSTRPYRWVNSSCKTWLLAVTKNQWANWIVITNEANNIKLLIEKTEKILFFIYSNKIRERGEYRTVENIVVSWSSHFLWPMIGYLVQSMKRTL